MVSFLSPIVCAWTVAFSLVTPLPAPRQWRNLLPASTNAGARCFNDLKTKTSSLGAREPRRSPEIHGTSGWNSAVDGLRGVFLGPSLLFRFTS